MRGEGKRDPRPADSPGRLRQSEAGKANAHHLKPFLPGQTGNREGKNGAKWLSQFREYFDSPSTDGDPRTRFQKVLNALYLRAIQGSDKAQAVIVDHMKGKATETVNVNNEHRPQVLVLLPTKGGKLEVPTDEDDAAEDALEKELEQEAAQVDQGGQDDRP